MLSPASKGPTRPYTTADVATQTIIHGLMASPPAPVPESNSVLDRASKFGPAKDLTDENHFHPLLCRLGWAT